MHCLLHICPKWNLLALAVLVTSCSSQDGWRGQPPVERLVDLRTEIPDLRIDLRYGTQRNVTGKPLYPAGMPCLAHQKTTQKLVKAQDFLRGRGYGLKIWDAWRPPEVQLLLHRHGADTGMFLDPKSGWSRHCAGIAVDATLVDANGIEQRMPTYFDEDLHHAAREYTGNDPEIRRNIQLLRQAMEQSGFATLESEWWHFDDEDYLRKPQPVVFGHELGLDFGVQVPGRVIRSGSTLLLAEPSEP